mmetsp:Transcript_25098/g.41146  ORF Transcript_25098/g.41146 Transcript_25098/m.41146 type:complete len:212 (-) Transcript_25098:319-954(-)
MLSTFLRPSDAALIFMSRVALTSRLSLMSIFCFSLRNIRRSFINSQASSSITTISAADDRDLIMPSRSPVNCRSQSTPSLSPSLHKVSPGLRIDNNLSTPSSETGETSFLIKNLSNKATNSSLSGNSFDAPTTQRILQDSRLPALSNFLSFRMVSKVFKIALFALKISSRKAISAVGRKPAVTLRYSSCSKDFKDRGPKSSSGVVKRVRSL